MGTLKLRRRRSALAAGLATIAMAVGLAAVPAQAIDKTDYVALGDSFAAGQGAGPYKNDTCYRSENTYSELAADTKAIKLIKNAACSGNTTQDVVGSQPHQLKTTTELVTITAGGNNLGFGDIVTSCGAADPDLVEACARASAAAASRIGSGQLAGEVAAMIQSVQAAAPNAKIVVTGYPYLFDPIPAGLTDPMSQFIYQATDLADGLNGSIALAAWETKVQFVDVGPAFAGHGINSNAPWINGATGNADGFHPNAEGYLAYYTAMKADGAYSAP
ncbi:SGNH/GDSL hydrolase family protein [uncultured Arthrobacter sp.]|uniref:SGNH/GDSL hydrolase family protein n=1 Tax=uncultured Arthrobacter sp. TaxID=114050 RepID=UPI003216D27E